MMTKEERQFVEGIADKLRMYRHEANMTQNQAHCKSGVGQTSINNYECARRNPSLLQMYRLCKTYGCEVKDLL